MAPRYCRHAALGIQFLDLSSSQAESLYHFVCEAEHEAAYRSGHYDKLTGPSPLFIAGAKERKILQRETLESHKRSGRAPMQLGIFEVSRRLQVILMFIKNRQRFPEDMLYRRWGGRPAPPVGM